jgi:hypothetical protein
MADDVPGIAPDSFRMPPHVAFALWQKDGLSADGLLRAFATWPAWHVRAATPPVGGGPPRVALEGDADPAEGTPAVHAWAFEDLRAAQDALGEDARLLELPGWVLFSVPASGEHIGVLLHLGEHGDPVHYRPVQRGLLLAWADVAAVETALLHPEDTLDALGLLHGYPAWQVPLLRHPDGSMGLFPAPDDDGRVLVTVLTSPDLQAGFQETLLSAGLLPPDAWEVLGGGALFELLRGSNAEGLVVNPLTSMQPRALRRDIADAVLARAPLRMASPRH